MALNFKGLQDEVLNHGFDETYRARVQVWLNEAQQRFAREVRIPDLLEAVTLQTTALSPLIGLPSDFLRLWNLVNTDVPSELDGSVLKTLDTAPTKIGRPIVFAIDEANSSIKLYPTPDQVYNHQLRYWRTPTEMTQTTDSPSTPAAYQDLLVTYALIKAYRAEDDFEASNFYANQFQTDLSRAATDLQFRDLTPRQVPGLWDY